MATTSIDVGTMKLTGTDMTLPTGMEMMAVPGIPDPRSLAVADAIAIAMKTRNQTARGAPAPISALPPTVGTPFSIARPSPRVKRARPDSPDDVPAHKPRASKLSKKAAKETKGQAIKDLIESDLPAYAFNTPPKLYVKVRDPKTGGNQWVLAKTSRNTVRHETEEQTPLSPCTDAQAMLIEHDIHPLLSGHDIDLGQAT